MTDTSNRTHPTHTIYKVLGDGETARWIKVGVAFPHKDKKGLALMFDGIPVDGRIALRVNKPRDQEQAPSARSNNRQPRPN
ncbi:MAG: hypothetical protein BGO82_11040 [Devosia sp. 67-54]|uniref:hypothetical protein n=1 Tax=unclassified Devosia TaxID=196773 RepID=UPI000963D8EF|nr:MULTISPECIES: hypothetical protein [unclassified Devosia]MBN9304827.1 hypothetical protein [Devosia sp.]OJX15591.1 MAG: hypothetical protein BGO82_11040 [Devosia sp. 67-54]